MVQPLEREVVREGQDTVPERRRVSSRGMTLIEIIVAMAVISLMVAGLTLSIGSLTGTKARAMAGELGGVVRSLYDQASLSGKTCRLVFDLGEGRDEDSVTKYWAECAAANITTSRNRDEAIKSDTKEREEQARAAKNNKSGFRRSGDGEPTLQELLDREKGRVENAAKYSSYTNSEIETRTLPSSVKVSVWTVHQRDPITRGLAYLYFFPQGFTEKAMVFIRQGNNVWTLTVAPLTGKTTVVAEELEVPRS
jgi:general secretion pathway protein H